MVTITQDGDVVANSEELFNSVGDVDQRDAASFQFAHEAKKLRGLRGGERARRLVHHDHFSSGANRGGDLHKLFPAGGECADDGIRVDVGSDGSQHSARAGAKLGVIYKTSAAREITEAEIFCHGEVRAKGEFLMNHGDPQFSSDERVGWLNNASIYF